MFCYAVERHFRGLECNSLTLAVFMALRPLKTPEKGFYGVAACHINDVLALQRPFAGRIASAAGIGLADIGFSDIG